MWLIYLNGILWPSTSLQVGLVIYIFDKYISLLQLIIISQQRSASKRLNITIHVELCEPTPPRQTFRSCFYFWLQITSCKSSRQTNILHWSQAMIPYLSCQLHCHIILAWLTMFESFKIHWIAARTSPQLSTIRSVCYSYDFITGTYDVENSYTLSKCMWFIMGRVLTHGRPMTYTYVSTLFHHWLNSTKQLGTNVDILSLGTKRSKSWIRFQQFYRNYIWKWLMSTVLFLPIWSKYGYAMTTKLRYERIKPGSTCVYV